MFKEVVQFLQKDKAKWSSIKEIENTLETIEANNKKIIELSKEQEKDTGKVLEDKAKKRVDLINKAAPLSNVLQVYAYDQGDSSLLKKISFSKNKLTKSKDSVVVEKINLAIKSTNQLLNQSVQKTKTKKTGSSKPVGTVNITDYGITPAMIEQLEDANTKFSEAIVAVKEAIAYKNKCAKKITEKIKTNRKLLINKLDKLMSLIELTDAPFYESYKNIRTSSQTSKEKPEKKEQATKESKANEINNKTVKPVTAAAKKTPSTKAPTRKTVPTRKPSMAKKPATKATPSKVTPTSKNPAPVKTMPNKAPETPAASNDPT